MIRMTPGRINNPEIPGNFVMLNSSQFSELSITRALFIGKLLIEQCVEFQEKLDPKEEKKAIIFTPGQKPNQPCCSHFRRMWSKIFAKFMHTRHPPTQHMYYCTYSRQHFNLQNFRKFAKMLESQTITGFVKIVVFLTTTII